MEPNLKNTLTPQPFDVKIPRSGIFRDSGGGSVIYLEKDGRRIAFDPTNLLTADEKLRAGNYGNQTALATQRFKEQYGLDINTLPQVNIGDLFSASRNSTSFGQINDVNEFLTAKPATLETQTLNTTPNILSPQAAQFRAAPPVITTQSIEEGIKALPVGGVPQGQNIQTFTTPSGVRVDAPTTLAPGMAGRINTESSRSEAPLGIASSTSNTSMADATAAGADATAKSIQDYIKLLTPETSETSTGVKNLLASITTDLEALKGRGPAQLSAEDAQGVAAKKQVLQNAQTELNQKLAEYKAIQAKYQALSTDVEGKPITMNSIIGSQAQIERAMRSELNMKSSEIAMIQANVAGAQGNLALAQDAADRAVDLKYNDAKDAIDIRLKQLELFEGQLTKEEKIRTDAVKLYLEDQKKKLAITTANEKDKNATLLNQMAKYPDAGITLNDTIESANRKVITRSEIYKKEARAASGDGASPTSYKEWTLAGSPGTYADWLKEQNTKAPTVAQQTVAEYAARIEQSNPIIDRLTKDITGMNLASFNAQVNMPPTFQSATMQQYMQAARNFINAKLRRESGAVISPSEFADARKQYLPQPGDTEEVLVQKKANRDLVFASLKNAAGSAYQSVDDLLGNTQTPAMPKTIEYPIGSEKIYNVAPDGTMTPQ